MTRAPQKDSLPDFATRWANRPRPQGAQAVAIVIGYLGVFWVLLPGLLYVAGVGLDRLCEVRPLQGDAWTYAGATLWIAGAGLVVWSTALFWFVGGGLPISHLPPVKLVTSGPYRIMAHPIYVGYTAGWLGFAMWMGSLGGVIGSTLILLVAWHFYTIYFEEPILRARFGDHDERVAHRR